MVWMFATFAAGLLMAVAASSVGTVVQSAAIDGSRLVLKARGKGLRKIYLDARLWVAWRVYLAWQFFQEHINAAEESSRGRGRGHRPSDINVILREATTQTAAAPTTAPRTNYVLRCYVDLRTTGTHEQKTDTEAGADAMPLPLSPVHQESNEFLRLFHFDIQDITERARELRLATSDAGDYILAPCYEIRRFLGVDPKCDVEVYFRDSEGEERAMLIAKIDDMLPEIVTHAVPLSRTPSSLLRPVGFKVAFAYVKVPGDTRIFTDLPAIVTSTSADQEDGSDSSGSGSGSPPPLARNELIKHCRRWIFKEPMEDEFSDKLAPRILRDFIFATGGPDIWRDEVRAIMGDTHACKDTDADADAGVTPQDGQDQNESQSQSADDNTSTNAQPGSEDAHSVSASASASASASVTDQSNCDDGGSDRDDDIDCFLPVPLELTIMCAPMNNYFTHTVYL